MNESTVLAEVEQQYGSLEDFVLYALTEVPEILEDNWSLDKKARESGLSLRSIAFLLNRSTKFRQIVRSDIVNQEFNLLSERYHIQEVVKVAVNRPVSRMSPTGEPSEVDQNPADVMKAGEYLNKYRNTPIDGGPKQNLVGLQVVFGGNGPEVSITSGEEVIEVESKALPASGYRPGRAGDTPPPDVRSRYEAAPDRSQPTGTPAAGGELDFYSAEVEEKARDKELAERASGEKARDRIVEKPVRGLVPNGDGRSGNEVLRSSLRNRKPKEIPRG